MSDDCATLFPAARGEGWCKPRCFGAIVRSLILVHVDPNPFPSMTQRQKTQTLILLGIADLLCFALGGLHYGEIWSGLGVLGLFLFLTLFEFL